MTIKRPKRSKVEIELSVKGIVVGSGPMRPVLILRGSEEEELMPVWLNAHEFENLDPNSTQVLKSSYFHQVTSKILKELGYQLEKCCFTEVVGHHQYVELHLRRQGDDSEKVIRSSAEESMPLCLALNPKFYATEEVMEKSRFANSELLAAQFEVPQHPYMM